MTRLCRSWRSAGCSRFCALDVVLPAGGGFHPDDLALMRRIDELYLASPFYGSRRMVAVLRREGRGGEPQTGAAADAADGSGGDLSKAEHQSGPSGSQGVSLPAARSEHRAGEPSVVRGHYLYSDGARVCLPGRGDGLVQPAGSVVAVCRITMEADFCVEAVQEALAAHGWAAGDFQHRSGGAVHQCRVRGGWLSFVQRRATASGSGLPERHVRCSSAKPVSMWITPAHRYALLLRYHTCSQVHNIKKKKKY